MLLCYNHAKTTTFSAQSFTGKERDSETGFSYFGARYYDSDILTGWLSVDPLADKYPNLSPYAYCAWNPVKLVDPDGRKIRGVKYNKETGEFKYSRSAIRRGTDRYINARIKTANGKKGIESLLESSKKYKIEVTDKPIVVPTKEGLNQLSGKVIDGTHILISTAEKITEDCKAFILYDEVVYRNFNLKIDDMNQKISDQNFLKIMTDLGMQEFEKMYPFQTEEQKIHGIGAHEEVHAMGNPDETAAFDNEKKERLEYIQEVLQ